MEILTLIQPASRLLLWCQQSLSSPADGSARKRSMETGVQGKCQRLSLSHAAGIVPLMSDVVSPFPTWLTYQQVAERLGLRSASAAAARARRAKWPRRIRNDTLEAEVCVPTEVLAAGPRKVRKRRQPVDEDADNQAAAEAVAAAVAPLRRCQGN